MNTASLRKVGGSVMMSVPSALLAVLQWKAGEKVNVSIDSGKLVIEESKPKYSLEDLLAQCDTQAAFSLEEREWLDASPVGLEEV